MTLEEYAGQMVAGAMSTAPAECWFEVRRMPRSGRIAVSVHAICADGKHRCDGVEFGELDVASWPEGAHGTGRDLGRSAARGLAGT